MIRTRTDKYLAAHGKPPKGSGAWLFWIGGQFYGPPGPCTYSQARKQAKEMARLRGAKQIYVMP